MMKNTREHHVLYQGEDPLVVYFILKYGIRSPRMECKRVRVSPNNQLAHIVLETHLTTLDTSYPITTDLQYVSTVQFTNFVMAAEDNETAQWQVHL